MGYITGSWIIFSKKGPHMKKKVIKTSILLAALMLTPWPTWSADVEREALIALYDNTNGDGWYINSDWKVHPNHCGWYGVICEPWDYGNVVQINLWDNQLTGLLPPELSNLLYLEVLRLYDNQLTGSIPPELASLPNLWWIDLSFNYQLSGTIPPELGNLSNLRELLLDHNKLSGPIPAELGNLSNLEILNLGDNQLSDPIPSELGNLSKMRNLVLAGNPDLTCWETQEALEWALGLAWYNGPKDVCKIVHFVHLPIVSR